MGLTRPADGGIRIEIGELDLTDVPPERRFVVAASLERELARLVEVHGLPDGMEEAAERAAPPAGERANANPVLLGQALARSIYEGLR